MKFDLRNLGSMMAILWIGLSVGCNQGASYAELVTIYNQELQTLDRLTEQRSELQAKRDKLTAPSKGEQAANMLQGILQQAEALRDQNQQELPADANALVDQALENANEAKQIADQVLDAVASSGNASSETNAEAEAEIAKIDAELAKLDKEIEDQQARVDRAKEKRDEVAP